MNYSIKELRKSDLKCFEDLLETYNNLVETPMVPKQRVLKCFDKMKKQGTVIFVAVEKKSKKIIGALTLLVEYKLQRGGVIAGHLEDVVVRKGYEGLGIGSAMIQKAIQKAKKLGCYKVILDCEESLVVYYEKFGFKNNGIFMRSYL